MAKLLGAYHNITKKTFTELENRGFSSIFSDEDIALFSQEPIPDRNLICHKVNGICLLFFGTICNKEVFDLQNISCEQSENDELAESLIQFYVRKGDLLFDYLDGSYILILWDARRKKLHLCRDDYGTNLLYYYNDKNGGLVFSTDLNELLKVIGKKDLSTKALFEYLRFLDISPPYTIYDEVFFLEPEKVLITDPGGTNLKNKESGSTHLSLEIEDLSADPVECFEHLFRESVRRRIAGTKKLGVFLSGGIDSTLVCAFAAEMKNDLKAYTVGFEDPRYDESGIARRIAEYLGVDHEVLSYTADQDFAAFHDFVSKVPSIFADPAIIPTFQCFKNISGRVDLVLDGTGADTLIGIMPARYIRFILNHSRYMPLWLRKLLAKALHINKKIAAYRKLFEFEDAAELLIRWKGWTKEEISRLCGEPCDLSHTMSYQIYHNYTDKNLYGLYSKLMGALPDDRLHQSSSLFGPSVAFPFFDRNVQTYVRKLPIHYRYSEGQSKLLFRKVLEKYVPREIWDLAKHGFDYPFERLLQYRNFELVKTFLSSNVLNVHGLFDSEMVKEYADKFMAGDNSVKFKIWGLVLFQAWFVNYYSKL